MLILVGKVSFYQLPAARQVWPWLTFCVLLQPEIPLESQIPGLHTTSSEGLPTPSYNEATSRMKHLRKTFAFFFSQLVYKLSFALILDSDFYHPFLRKMQCVFKQDAVCVRVCV